MEFTDFSYRPGEFCVCLGGWTDADCTLLYERGLDGLGYTWAGVIRSLLARHKPAFLPEIEIDPEADNLALVS